MRSKLIAMFLLTGLFGLFAGQSGILPQRAGAAGRESAATAPPVPTAAAEVLSAAVPAHGPPATPSPSPSPSPESSPEPGAAAGPAAAVQPVTITSSGPVKNGTSLTVDVAALQAQELSLGTQSEDPVILILHTHATEAYTPEAGEEYEDCGDWRSTDDAFNVIRVGDALAAALQEQGLTVIHDRQMYDYPSYSGSYNRSAEAIENYLALYPGIRVILDVHRDALGDESLMYKVLARDTAEATAQLMFVVGSNESLEHPNWQENLKLALALQEAVCAENDSLMRPINLSSYRYNQQYTPGSLILEVGSCGNSLAEALRAVEIFAQKAGPVLAGLME